MARPVTPLNEKTIKEYEKKIKAAVKEKDTQRIKEIKRLFLVYIKKRGKDIKDFKEHRIYRFFINREKPKRIDVLKQEIKELKEKDLRDYLVENIKEVFEGDSKNIVNRYFNNTLDDYLADGKDLLKETKGLIKDLIKEYNKNFDLTSIQKQSLKSKIETKENELARLENKKYKMREYRERMKNTIVKRKPKNKSIKK